MGEVLSLIFFFQPKIYINGKQIFLDEKCHKNLKRFLDAFNPTNEEELQKQFAEIYNLKNIRKIFGKLIPEDSELLNPKDFECERDYISLLLNKLQKIYNFYSQGLDTKINIKSSSFKFYGLKVLEECKKFNIYEFNPSIKEEKLSYSIIIFGTKELNEKFLNGFLNFLFDVNEDDNYRLSLGVNVDKPKDLFNEIYINSKKGNFIFYCFDPNQKEFNDFIEAWKSVENKFINLILFNNYDSQSLPNFDIKDPEKYNIFFTCPCIGLNYFIFKVFEKENKILEKNSSIKELPFETKLMVFKETVLKKAEFDQSMIQKVSSSYFDYDSIFNKEKNRDIYYKYSITMDGYKSFYNKVTQGKLYSINCFSSFIKFLLDIQDKSKNIEKKINNFNVKKGENWTEYHLYEMKIKNLSKNEQSKKTNSQEIELLNEKKKIVYNTNKIKINSEIRNFNNFLNNTENLKLYEILLLGYYHKKLIKKEIEESSSRCC